MATRGRFGAFDISRGFPLPVDEAVRREQNGEQRKAQESIPARESSAKAAESLFTKAIASFRRSMPPPEMFITTVGARAAASTASASSVSGMPTMKPSASRASSWRTTSAVNSCRVR